MNSKIRVRTSKRQGVHVLCNASCCCFRRFRNFDFSKILGKSDNKIFGELASPSRAFGQSRVCEGLPFSNEPFCERQLPRLRKAKPPFKTDLKKAKRFLRRAQASLGRANAKAQFRVEFRKVKAGRTPSVHPIFA